MDGVVNAIITEERLEDIVGPAVAGMYTDEMGAVVGFEGIVRNHDQGKSVASLSYSAHPQAAEFMREIACQVAAEHPEVSLWAAHRVGELAIGEYAFVVRVASAHRAPAFEAARKLVDRVKTGVPIWKEQEWSDGSTSWVGSE